MSQSNSSHPTPNFPPSSTSPNEDIQNSFKFNPDIPEDNFKHHCRDQQEYTSLLFRNSLINVTLIDIDGHRTSKEISQQAAILQEINIPQNFLQVFDALPKNSFDKKILTPFIRLLLDFQIQVLATQALSYRCQLTLQILQSQGNSLLLFISKIAENFQSSDQLDSLYCSFYEEFRSTFPDVILIQIKPYREQDAKEVLFKFFPY